MDSQNGNSEKIPLRLAFGCQARVGKSTAVSYLVENYGGVERSFAGNVYRILHYAQDVCQFERGKDREFLQFVGTWARNKDVNTWIKSALRDIDLESDNNVYFSDVRFPNEFDALRKKGYIMVRIIRNSSKEIFGNKGDSSHESETSLLSKPLEDWDYVIENNGSIEDFYHKLDQFISIII